jgi:flagellar protein FliO/FliZ
MSERTERNTRLSAGMLGFCLVLFLYSTMAVAQANAESNGASATSASDQNPVTQIDSPASIPEPRTPSAILSKNQAPVATAPKAGPGANLMSVVFGLLVILGLIFALAWVVRKMGQGGLMNNSHIKVVSAMPLGTRERLVVIDIAGQQLLLGITATQINTLHVFPEPVIHQPDSSGQSEFGKKLLAILQQKPLHSDSPVRPAAPDNLNVSDHSKKTPPGSNS